MSESRERLLKKIKQLALHGYGGEKDNAQILLKNLMQKYNISENDLDDNRRVDWSYKVPNKNSSKQLNKLFYQILSLTLQNLNIDISDIKIYRNGSLIQCISTLEFKIQFITAYEFYRDRFKKDLNIFYLAYLTKNRLLINRKNDDEPTQAEIELHIDAELMSLGLRKHDFNKQIEVSK